MYKDKYFKVKKSYRDYDGWTREGTTLYCVDEDIHYAYFKNTMTAILYTKLKTEQVVKYLTECNKVDKLSLFLIHNKSILSIVLPYYDYLPTVGKYVIDDLEKGYITKAYNTLESHIDVIRHSYLGEQLRLHCISL